MSDKRYEANIIRATAVEPANNLETTSAPGVWSLDEVMELQKKNKWPTVGNEAVDLDNLFGCFMYDGTGAPQVVDNGVALANANEGGSVNFGGAGSLRWVNVPGSSDFGFGTGDFTIELFLFVQTHRNYTEIYDQRTASQDAATATPIIYADASGGIHFFHSNQNKISGSIAAGQWYHIAVSRSGTSTKMFANGTQIGSTYSDSTNYVTPASTWSIGAAAQQNQYEMDGFISNVRVVKGTALYTSNFTAPTSALTAVTNTKLLALQGSTPFVDNSSSSHALTINGASGASDFGPFTGTSGKGGLVWIKGRTDPGDGTGLPDHTLFDTVRGDDKYLRTSNSQAQGSGFSSLFEFNANGFTVGSNHSINYGSGDTHYISWAFAQQAKFFDIVQFTGDGNSSQTINHNLGVTPGMIICKRTNTTGNWITGHIYDYSKYVMLNSNNAAATWNGNWSASNTSFTAHKAGNADYSLNESGSTYIAYVFAHNNNDGGFGPNGSADVIKCGSLTVSSQAIVDVNLGFEAQWVMLKRTDSTGNWFIFDTMRGMSLTGFEWIYANSNTTEVKTYQGVFATATGFGFNPANNGQFADGDYIYMAITRTPQATPTTGTDVFTTVAYSTSSGPFTIDAGFPPDMAIAYYRNTASGNSGFLSDRVRGRDRYLFTPATTAEGNVTGWANYGASMKGIETAASGSWTNGNSFVWWNWKRAPGYFDITTWTGTGSALNINHNLGVEPEMIWVKTRSDSVGWAVYHNSQGFSKGARLDTTDAFGTETNRVTAASSTTISVGTDAYVNVSSRTYVAYLFATVAGVSKVGSYTGDGTTGRVIDCGFTSGARFVLIKPTSQTGGWNVYDTVRGIVAGNDPVLILNSTAAESTPGDDIDPDNSGFIVNQQALGNFLNGSGVDYIFYAIA
tara:strand:- start:339 stop:3059 length:2721 start_codon:yes stop_codon:yes gene_type:complete